ncbi:MAG: hypothetical protein HFH97_17845 [Lachnospiraceae bacterium]|jgi:uncharacterized phosphosugar-binding protein|nr:hypothetical protein [uncultured Acetatifactor sp.]MCI9229883.1 hypothetical protein [Lachnospiraceae bacterium]MCI9574437.1 hypothetical protein [Lachnospiraceae bacterium]
MELMERYQEAALELLGKVRTTQKDVIRKAGEMVAEAAEHGQKIYFTRVVHGIEHDLISRGGGPIFYQEYKKGETALKEGDILFMGSVSGRTAEEVELAYNSVNAGVKVILLTSIAYSDAVEPVHPSGKRLYEIATLAIDMCVPVAEALLDVEGLDARFAASSGIASTFILWSLTSVAVEKMLAEGYKPGVFRSHNFPGGPEHNEAIKAHYAEYGW